MVPHTFLILVAATLSSAITPNGFQPSAQADLLLSYGNMAVGGGATVQREVTQVQPSLATTERLTGQYAVFMIDIDVPADTPPQTRTLLHWLQTGLGSAQTATMVNTTTGPRQAFLLQNRNNTGALVTYFGPNPPARIPLSHRYTFLLVNHTQITQQGLTALMAAATPASGTNRVFDFDAPAVLQSAGLSNGVVAGNFFNVTNPGPLNDTRAGAGGNQSTASVATTVQGTAGTVAALCLGLVGGMFWLM